MNRDEFAFKIDIYRNGQFYKKFDLPWTNCADQVMADLVGHLNRTDTKITFEWEHGGVEVTDSQISYTE